MTIQYPAAMSAADALIHDRTVRRIWDRVGLWIEQLIAESTGKHGSGALPVVDEPLGTPDEYGNDRAFVAIATETIEQLFAEAMK